MGSVGARENNTQSSSRISGAVDLTTLRNASENRVTFDKITNLYMQVGDSKTARSVTSVSRVKDMVSSVVDKNPTDFVGEIWDDKRGAKFIQQLQDAGYGIQAHAQVSSAQGNIPARNAYLFVKIGAKRK